MFKDDAKLLNDKGLHDNWTFKILVARYSLLDARLSSIQ